MIATHIILTGFVRFSPYCPTDYRPHKSILSKKVNLSNNPYVPLELKKTPKMSSSNYLRIFTFKSVTYTKICLFSELSSDF